MAKTDPKKWIIFTQIALQMGVTIGLFVWIGLWLDGDEGKLFTVIFSLLGVFIALYAVIKQVIKMGK